MVSAYINLMFQHNESGVSLWYAQSNYSFPWDASGMSSLAVQDVAAAFMADMNGQELRLILVVQSIEGFEDNGRDGALFELTSGCLEKGLPELPSIGLGADHEGMACWNADGTGPEPEAVGHTFWYGGTERWMPYYFASRDYDDIDSDPNAAFCHFIDAGAGFPNLKTQLAYRGYTMDQLKAKTDIATLGRLGLGWSYPLV